ncbi:MAG TPA: enoyl-CoA hydratase-related protein [Dehalococcoidales bacterium]|nr:enoyl-CoA hydratase-related protein [Dehalococcoidales bacterium]
MAIYYQLEGHVATFTIDNPHSYNAIDVKTLREFQDIMHKFRDDENAWVGIITGAGEKAFCTGADIADMLPFIKSIRGKSWLMPDTPLRFMEMYKPLIAAVNGFALGGGLEMMLICDIRVAAEHAQFGVPEITLGLIPGWGGTQRLSRELPYCKAAELVLSGKKINAQEALRIGLINEVVPKEQVLTSAKNWAENLCQVGPLALRAGKQSMLTGREISLPEGIKLEATLFDYLLSTEDFEEGRSAFLQKRKPVFKAK